ncbi:MAG: hypothetical protein A2Y53_03835 [Chloroflexi bacterium RBG_16_47_49]|nr:MAG: hypothetical protein A2Y53_03835 [Chloroflexi bacterium RBG_16_47_49]
MTRQRLYTPKDLLEEMGESGLPCSRMWLRTVERKGLLVSPRLPNSRRDRVYTLDQIHEIVHAFSVNGKGRWP